MVGNARSEFLAKKAAEAPQLLGELNKVVGMMMENNRHCVHGVALFVLTAKKLGYAAVPVPVAVVATNEATMGAVAVGTDAHPVAAKLGFDVDAATATDSVEGWDGAGHVVAAAGGVMYDPTFRQFAARGLPDVSIAGTITDAQLEGGEWEFELEGGSTIVRYIRAEHDTTWREGYEHVISGRNAEQTATELAGWLRQGYTAEKMELV